MNDRTADGQFAEPVFGREAAEREAGYSPMHDPNKESEADELTLDDAAAMRATQANEPVARAYTSDVGLVDSSETVTLERAASDLTALRRSEAQRDQDDAAETLRKHIDGLRGKDGADAAGDAEHTEAKAEGDAEPASEGDLEPDLEKALSHPRVAEAIRARVAETETTRQQYQAGIDAAMTIAQQAFMSQFPEFANVTSPEQSAQVAQAIAQQNPGRWAQIQSAFANSSRLIEAQHIESQRAAERQAAEFSTYAKEQDAAFDKLAGDVTPEVQQRAMAEIIAGVKEFGIEPADFMKQFGSDRTLRSAPFQRMMLEAGLYRLAKKAAGEQMRRNVPHVARPGSAVPRGSYGAEKLRALSASFQSDPSLKNAAAALSARRAANRG